MRYVTFLIAGIFVCLGGCTLRNSQLTTCQAEKEQLLTTIRTQRDTSRTLQTQVASLESRLDQAEKELARTSTGTRLSSVPSSASDTPRTVPSAPSTPSTIRRNSDIAGEIAILVWALKRLSLEISEEGFQLLKMESTILKTS